MFWKTFTKFCFPKRLNGYISGRCGAVLSVGAFFLFLVLSLPGQTVTPSAPSCSRGQRRWRYRTPSISVF